MRLTTFSRYWLLAGMVLALTLMSTAALAVTEPPILVYGTIHLGGGKKGIVTSADTDVTVVVRKTISGKVMASYRMGSNPQGGKYFYSLRLKEEAKSERAADTLQVGEFIYVSVRKGTRTVATKRAKIFERGQVVHLQFGKSFDTSDNASTGSATTFAASSKSSSSAALAAAIEGAATGTKSAAVTNDFALNVNLTPDGVVISFRAASADQTQKNLGGQPYYAIETTTNLVSGQWTPLPNYSAIPGENQTVNCVVTPESPNVSFRGRVWITAP